MDSNIFFQRYGQIEEAYRQQEWSTVMEQGKTLLDDLETQSEAEAGVKPRLQLLMAHALLYGYNDALMAEDLYTRVSADGSDSALQPLAEEGINHCRAIRAQRRDNEARAETEAAQQRLAETEMKKISGNPRPHFFSRGSGLRGLSVLALSLGTALGVIYTGHKSYWEGTIHRTQTVDFNILSNLLSTKLSLLLPRSLSSKSDRSDIQQAIDSNYGLFGIIVTNCSVENVLCPNQKILFASQSTVKEEGNGRQKIIPKNENKYAKNWITELEKDKNMDRALAHSPYILLRDPPPTSQEWGFKSPRNDEKVYLKKSKGNIIGRVYLVRAVMPSFYGEMQNWLKDIPQALTRKPGPNINPKSLAYNSIARYSLITGLLIFFLTEVAYYRTRLARYHKTNAVNEHLATQQTLNNALVKADKTNQIRLQAEKIARSATEESERAIRDKKKVEDAARAISQEATQEKLKSEELVRIADDNSRKAIRDKQEAEEKARIATENYEQAVREKEEAEDRARTASNEKEAARRDARELYDKIDTDIKYTKELERKVEALISKIHQPNLDYIDVKPEKKFDENLTTQIISSSKTERKWVLGFSSEFNSQINQLDRNMQGRVLEAISEINKAPMTIKGNTIKPLNQNFAGYWRYRIGEFRLIYYPDSLTSTIRLISFKARGGAYKL
jgi:mRNA-degrading endonuclease RelE of RelBE toxin-antitoxin system